MKTGMKLLNSTQVRELAEKTLSRNLDQRLPVNVLTKLADDKFHLASIMRSTTRETDRLYYHRVAIMLGLVDRSDKRRAMLDVADEDWAELPDAEAVRAAVRAQKDD